MLQYYYCRDCITDLCTTQYDYLFTKLNMLLISLIANRKAWKLISNTDTKYSKCSKCRIKLYVLVSHLIRFSKDHPSESHWSQHICHCVVDIYETLCLYIDSFITNSLNCISTFYIYIPVWIAVLTWCVCYMQCQAPIPFTWNTRQITFLQGAVYA